MKNRMALLYFLVLLTWLAVACSSPGGPKQIAAAQRITPIAEYPENYSIIYQASIELQVSDVDAAVLQAEKLAGRYGGYISGSQSWYVDQQKVIRQQLLVPTQNFDQLRLSLKNLGILINESTVTREIDPYPFETVTYSSISLQMESSSRVWIPEPPSTQWNPARTFQRAYGVFLTIFGFLADVVIWILVVIGPFVLLIAGGYWLFRYARRKS
jgi:hypothetical protein